MNRVFAVLMIPLLASGNLFSHSHGMGIAPSDHGQRPHIHLGIASHSHDGHLGGHGHTGRDDDHHHDHEGGQRGGGAVPDDKAPVDHDSDAVYLISGKPFLPVSERANADTTPEPAGFVAPSHGVHASDAQPNRRDPAGSYPTGPPLFLLHAVLRL